MEINFDRAEIDSDMTEMSFYITEMANDMTEINSGSLEITANRAEMSSYSMEIAAAATETTNVGAVMRDKAPKINDLRHVLRLYRHAARARRRFICGPDA